MSPMGKCLMGICRHGYMSHGYMSPNLLSHVKEEKTSGLKDKAMRDTRKLQESLKWVRKQRQEMEEELADLKMKQ